MISGNTLTEPFRLRLFFYLLFFSVTCYAFHRVPETLQTVKYVIIRKFRVYAHEHKTWTSVKVKSEFTACKVKACMSLCSAAVFNLKFSLLH